MSSHSLDSTERESGQLTAENLAALHAYLAAREVVSAAATLEVTILTGGRSNLTYVVTDGVTEWILRSPPRRGAAPSAHDVVREHRVMSQLHGTPVPVPRMVALCEDLQVLGVPFLVMERVRGVVWREPSDVVDVCLEDRTRACHALVDTLAALHAVDPALVSSRAAPGRGYLERQVGRWSAQWLRWKSRDVPAIEVLQRRLSERLPAGARVSLVHGDYRFDNVMLGDGGRVDAVLDWELSTVGDPLADLGSLVAFWGRTDVTPVLAHQEMTRMPGFLTAREVAERYAQQTGAGLGDFGVYVAFGCFRWAVIREGILARSRLNGAADDEQAALASSVIDIAARAIAVLDGKEEL